MTDELKEDIEQLKKYRQETEQKLADQRKFEVLDRFCRGILQEKISDLKDLLYILSVELDGSPLAYAPIGFVFVTYYLHHERNALPEFFCQFPPHLHLKNIATLKCVPPTSELTLRTLSSIMNGPYGDSVQLLIHLWVIRADLSRKQNFVACPVPNLTFASETLQALIHDPDQQALVEQILPSLVDEEDINYEIKYFLPSW
ncbi:uncharacterized protein EV420DRAFT_1709654 [Desarmillaria tabescens]|uniref:Uncharacterized protein n=1 Tax=Armillaria tabescens TaxID=1929756 RepID=A0AA39NHZ8_ARMTA|nr:uncharacterized protein EV420DRAFT_1709654 [Desarmillaria tabescens]KAK0465997.1 hypothetical protein EV420DRAFT_1709654 [Desarmillaria tabescens]